MFVCVWRGGGHTDTKTVCRTVSVEVKYRNTQFRACGKLNISKSKNSNFELSTKCILIKNLSLIKTVFKFNFFTFFILFYSFSYFFIYFFIIIFFIFFLFLFFHLYFFNIFILFYFFIFIFLIYKYTYFNIF